MAITSFFKRNWIHFTAIGIFLIVGLVYFNMQLKGYGLKQHDIEQYIGMAHESDSYKEENGEQILWTNSVFGGMPTTQISMNHPGNLFGRITSKFLVMFPSPMGIVLLYMLCFYLMLSMMKVNKWVSIFGALLFAFLSYQIIILQAGHNSKGIAIAFMAPVVGAFFMTYRRNWIWGAILSAVFLSFEMASNHLQITYYLFILLLGLGLVEVVRVFKSKDFKKFFKSTVAIIAGYGLAIMVNFGNVIITNDYAKTTIRGGNDITITPNGTANTSQTDDGLDKEYITAYSYGVDESFTLLSPYVKGGGSMAIGESPFVDKVENSDLTLEQKNAVMNNVAYWGDQPMVSGPVYIGVITILLALLGMIYIKDPIKWALLGVAILTLMLSWGKNYMGLTDWFIENVPGYNKFRAVTIILVIVELCVPLIAILFLDRLIKEKESIKANIKPFYIATGVFLVFIIGLKMTGIDKSYLSSSESDPKMIERQKTAVIEQIMNMSPEQLQQNGIDKNNPAVIQQIVDGQVERINDNLASLQTIRKEIFNSSMNRTLFISVLAIGLLFLFFKTSVPSMVSIAGLGLIMFIDVVSVSLNYLNNSENNNGYKYWTSKLEAKYPIAPEIGDFSILENESQNPKVKNAVDKGFAKGKQKALELEAVGAEVKRIENAYGFAALNRVTNYRVFDFSGGFNSNRTSYFHKSLGGYHGAKLRSIQNIADFHINKSNNKVFDMLNVKYFLQPTDSGLVANLNPTALGNGWFVKGVKIVNSPNEALLSLGSSFSLKNSGNGRFYVNGKQLESAVVYGSEKLQYLESGSKDTITVPLSNGIPKGVEVVFVKDKNGKTDLIMKQGLLMDSTKSFTPLVDISVKDEFLPKEVAVVEKAISNKLNLKTWSGNGTVNLLKYNPVNMVYQVNSKDGGLVVFSEIFYEDGWKATVDGKPTEILKVNYLLRGLSMKPGSHKVVFTFENPKYQKYNMISLILSIIILSLFSGYLIFQLKTTKNKAVEVE